MQESGRIPSHVTLIEALEHPHRRNQTYIIPPSKTAALYSRKFPSCDAQTWIECERGVDVCNGYVRSVIVCT